RRLHLRRREAQEDEAGWYHRRCRPEDRRGEAWVAGDGMGLGNQERTAPRGSLLQRGDEDPFGQRDGPFPRVAGRGGRRQGEGRPRLSHWKAALAGSVAS